MMMTFLAHFYTFSIGFYDEKSPNTLPMSRLGRLSLLKLCWLDFMSHSKLLSSFSLVFAGAMCCLRPNKNLQWNTNKKKADKKIEDNSRNRQCRRRMLILIKVLAFLCAIFFFFRSAEISFRHYFNDTCVLFLMTFVVVGQMRNVLRVREKFLFLLFGAHNPHTDTAHQPPRKRRANCAISYNWFDLIWWRPMPQILCIFDCSHSRANSIYWSNVTHWPSHHRNCWGRQFSEILNSLSRFIENMLLWDGKLLETPKTLTKAFPTRPSCWSSFTHKNFNIS